MTDTTVTPEFEAAARVEAEQGGVWAGSAPRFYTFTGPELTQLLTDGIDLFLEYRDKHGREEADARTIAPFEALLGLDAEDELYRMNECHTTHEREGEPVSLLGRLEGER